MTLCRTIILLLLFGGLPGNGPQQGRRGNVFYERREYQKAADAYSAGLVDDAKAGPDVTRHGLLNNLGMARHRLKDYRGAAEAFGRAMEAAPSREAYGRSAYNAGNASYALDDLQRAADHYRDALIADPNNQDARFNYEFVRRRMKRQDQQKQQQGGKPSGQQQDGKDEQQGQNQDDRQDQEQQGQGQNERPTQLPPDQESQKGQSPQQRESGMTREQAEQYLEALRNDEQQLMKDARRMKAAPRVVEKDW